MGPSKSSQNSHSGFLLLHSAAKVGPAIIAIAIVADRRSRLAVTYGTFHSHCLIGKGGSKREVRTPGASFGHRHAGRLVARNALSFDYVVTMASLLRRVCPPGLTWRAAFDFHVNPPGPRRTGESNPITVAMTICTTGALLSASRNPSR